MSALRFHVLGPVRAFCAGNELGLGSPAQRTVLASLLLRNGDVVTIDTIARALWGEEERPTSGAGLIRTYISRLRRILGPSVIERIFDGYRIPEMTAEVDLADFRCHVRVARERRKAGDCRQMVSELRAALALWDGSPLAGTTRLFVQQHAEHLNELRVDVLEQCLGAELELGQHEDVISELLAAVEEYPFRENLVASCMVSLQRCGRTAQAIALYGRTRDMLAAELGIDPGLKLQECYHAALRRRLPRAVSAAEPRTIGATRPGTAPTDLLVGMGVDNTSGPMRGM